MVKKLRKAEVELNEAYQKVLLWFFSFPNIEMGLNDLSEAVSISKTTAKRIVNQLEDEGFLIKEEFGNVWRIKCNQGHIYNFSRKIASNMLRIYESGILDTIHELVPNRRSVILFGSYRKGDDTEKSDIDIAVEVLDDKEIEIHKVGVFSKFEYRKDIMVNMHIFSRNKVDLNLFANIANGIVLEGFLEVRP